MTTNRRLCAILGASTVSVLVLFLGSAGAAPGDLDPSFGTDGYVTTVVGTSNAFAEGLVLQPDGKIVVGGSGWDDFALARYLPDGSLDFGFGTLGIVIGPAGSATALALQPDGKLLLAGGSAFGVFTLVRYLADGTIDLDFGTNGIVHGRGTATGIAVQPDGRIVVVGGIQTSADSTSVLIARFRDDGSPDVGFGLNGVVTTRIGSSSAASTVAVQQDGKILVGGTTASSISAYQGSMVLARYAPDGSLDPGFGTGGTLTTTIGTNVYLGSRLALQPDGRIVAVASLDKIVVARYLPNGTPDVSFGAQGIADGPSAGADGVALQPDGRIVVAGGSVSSLVVVRFEPDGALDTGFGDAGVAATTFGWSGYASGVAVQPDGRIVAGGTAYGPGSVRFGVARFLVANPSSIGATPSEVDYGQAIQLTGALTTRQPGALTLLRRACYEYSRNVAARLSAGDGGAWRAQVQPGSRTTYWAAVGSDQSSPIVVSVRPLLKLERLSPRLVRARVLFGHSLAGENIVLERRSGQDWSAFSRGVLKRIKRSRLGVVSGLTFRLHGRVHQQIRLWLPQPNPYDCFAEARSAPIR